MDLKESKKEQLYLYDLDIGSKLVLNFNVKGHPFEFHVKVEKIIHKIILLHKIYSVPLSVNTQLKSISFII